MEAGAILRYERKLAYFGALVDDRLEVHDDGTIWRWSLAPARAERKDEAGTFRMSLAEAERDEVRRMAVDLARVGAGQPAPHGHIERLVEIDDRLIELPDPRAAGELADASRRLDELAERALGSPLAVARLSASSASSAVDQTRLAFVFEALGSKPVRLVTPAGGYSLLAVRREGNREVFRGREEQTIGFLDEDGEELDGLRRPAVLAPGRRATIVFRGGLAPQAGDARLVAIVEGKIGLLGPGFEHDFPRSSFRLSVDVAS